LRQALSVAGSTVGSVVVAWGKEPGGCPCCGCRMGASALVHLDSAEAQAGLVKSPKVFKMFYEVQ